jgi:hypothetical protein
MASFFASSVALWRAERIGEGILVRGERAVSEIRSEEACREMVGCVSPRRTRLMAVGE